MSKAWTNIPATDIDAESFVTEDILGDFHDNQEALISGPIDTKFAQVDTSGSPAAYTALLLVPVYIHPPVNTDKGDVVLVVRFEGWTDASTTVDIRMRLASGTFVEVTGITVTSPTFQTLTISSTDVKANADSEVNLEVEARVTAGAGEARVRCLSASSRLERAT